MFILTISQQNKGKKKKKGVLPGGGLKAQMRDDLDYAEFDGGYAQDYEDFMWHWLHHPFPSQPSEMQLYLLMLSSAILENLNYVLPLHFA